MTHVLFYRCKDLPVLTLVLMCCLSLLCLSCKSGNRVDQTLPPVTAAMFFQQMPSGGEVIIDAGPLGKYKFLAEAGSPNVTIQPELIALLNKLQGVFKHPMHIIVGHRSQQHQIYLWAKWLSGYSEQVAALNAQNHASWEAWVKASQELPGCPSLQSKHQSGAAASFYWETLVIESDEQRASLRQQVREAGGTQAYTPDDRSRFGIPAGDNYLFHVTAYLSGEAGAGEAPPGRAYIHVMYQPSVEPAMPSIDKIGTLIEASEPEPPPEPEPPSQPVPVPPSQPEPPPAPEKNLYTRGEILLVDAAGYRYFAEVTADTKLGATTVPVLFFVEDIRQSVGNTVPVSTVATKREIPPNGWGNQKVLLQYFDGTQWVLGRNVTVFEDYYLLPESTMGERRLPLSKVRIPIFKTK